MLQKAYCPCEVSFHCVGMHLFYRTFQYISIFSHFALFGVFLYFDCQRASRAKTRVLRSGQLNAARGVAAGRKILDRAVKSVM